MNQPFAIIFNFPISKLIDRFMCGSFVFGLSAHVYKLGELSDSGRYTGMIMTVGAAGALCGMPISGAINQLTEDFKIVGYYAGLFSKTWCELKIMNN